MSIIFRDDTRPASLLDYRITVPACADLCEQGRAPCPCPDECAQGGVTLRSLLWGFVGSTLIVASIAGCITLLGVLP